LDSLFTSFYSPGLLFDVLSGRAPESPFNLDLLLRIPGLRTMARAGAFDQIEDRAGGSVLCFHQNPTALGIGLFGSPRNDACPWEVPVPVSRAEIQRYLSSAGAAPVPKPQPGRDTVAPDATFHIATFGIG